MTTASTVAAATTHLQCELSVDSCDHWPKFEGEGSVNPCLQPLFGGTQTLILDPQAHAVVFNDLKCSASFGSDFIIWLIERAGTREGLCGPISDLTENSMWGLRKYSLNRATLHLHLYFDYQDTSNGFFAIIEQLSGECQKTTNQV